MIPLFMYRLPDKTIYLVQSVFTLSVLEISVLLSFVSFDNAKFGHLTLQSFGFITPMLASRWLTMPCNFRHLGILRLSVYFLFLL